MVSPALSPDLQIGRDLTKEVFQNVKRALLQIPERNGNHVPAALSQGKLSCKVLCTMKIGRVFRTGTLVRPFRNQHGGKTAAMVDDHLVPRMVHARAFADIYGHIECGTEYAIPGVFQQLAYGATARMVASVSEERKFAIFDAPVQSERCQHGRVDVGSATRRHFELLRQLTVVKRNNIAEFHPPGRG